MLQARDPEIARRKAEFHLKGQECFDPDLLHYFHKTMELCGRHGIGVVFVSYPVTADYYRCAADLIAFERWRAGINALIGRYPDLLWLDYQKGFFGQDHLFDDSDHLNVRGAELFSRKVKEDLGQWHRGAVMVQTSCAER